MTLKKYFKAKYIFYNYIYPHILYPLKMQFVEINMKIYWSLNSVLNMQLLKNAICM